MYNDLFSIGPLTVHGYGLMIGIGSLVAVFWSQYRAKKKGLSEDVVLSLGLLVIIVGWLGAKALYTITVWRQFIAHPLQVLGTEGFVVYGGITAGVLSALLYCRKKKADFLRYADLIMPAVAAAQGFGRIGCFLAGCCYGAPTDSCLGVTFPHGGMAPAGVPLWPTQLISSAADFLLMAVLLLYGRKERIKGNVLALYVLLYSIGRFLVEFLRNDPRGAVGALSTSQFISIFTVALGIILFYVNYKREQPPAPAENASAPSEDASTPAEDEEYE